MMKKALSVALVGLLCASVQAEPIRTALTKENNLPRLYQAELGAEAYYYDVKGGDASELVPYVRYTLLPDFAVFATLPYVTVNPDFGKKESGIGDATLGVEFVPYKNLFGYPWIMPHAEVIFDTGDEKKGLGTGATEYQVGVAIGTTVNRVFHWAADARYLIVDEGDNIPSIAGSVVWDLDKKFSLMAELELSREKNVMDEFGFVDDRHPLVFVVGMHYKATRDLQFSLHGGATKNSDVDSVIRGKVSYSF